MNSHDKGVAFALANEEVRAMMHHRQIWTADITDAMAGGFESEPKLAPEHLALLSDHALAEIHQQSERWRDRSRERELEAQLLKSQESEKAITVHYIAIREILGTQDVPHYYNPKPGKPKHIQYTEQRARALVAQAEASEKNRKAAEDAEARVDLIGRYVKACDDKRRPYDWRIFTMPTKILRELVNLTESDTTERLGRYTSNLSDARDFEKRLEQEAEQSARLRGQRIDEARLLVINLSNHGQIPVERANQILDVLLGREQAGEKLITRPEGRGWHEWNADQMPAGLNDDDTVAIVTKDGKENTLTAAVVDWEQVKFFRVK